MNEAERVTEYVKMGFTESEGLVLATVPELDPASVQGLLWFGLSRTLALEIFA